MAAPIIGGVISSPYGEIDTRGRSVPQVITECFNTFADNIVAVDQNTSLTAGQFLSKVRRYATGFQNCGVAPGVRVCAHLHNNVENMAALLAVVFAGGTVVPAKPTLVPRELIYQMRDSDCTYILADERSAHNVLKIKDEYPLKGLFVTGSFDGFTSVQQFEELSEDALTEYVPSDTKEEVAVVTFTSGSTGFPKAVEITHSAYVSSLLSFRMLNLVNDEDVTLTSNPLTHLSGILFTVFVMCYGSMAVYRDPHISLQELVNVIEKHKISAILSFPVKMQSVVNDALRTKTPLPRVRKIVLGGSLLSTALGEAVCDLFRCESFVNVYGLSEITGLATATPAGQITIENSGFPTPGTKVKITDVSTGDILGPLERGEIRVQSQCVMKGYYKQPGATAAMLGDDGWMKTGDLGYYDEEGHLYIVERLKEMIKCMAEQVSPAELEHILLSHDAVKEVVVVGVPNAKYGEAAAACVVLDEACKLPKEEIEQELKELVAGQTAVHKHLYGGVIFLTSIPKTENGKITRRELKLKITGK